MTDLSFSIPSPLHSRIEHRATEAGYADVGDYVRDLIERDLERAEAIVRVRALIEEGEASGYLDAEPEDLIEEIIAQRHARRG